MRKVVPYLFTKVISKVTVGADFEGRRMSNSGAIGKSTVAIVHAGCESDAVLSSQINQELRLSMASQRRLISPVVRILLEFCQRNELLCEREQMRSGVALEEALVNAVIHGNLEVPSELRDLDNGTFEHLIAVRLEKPPYKHRRIHVTVAYTSSEVSFTIRDEGAGFDVSTVPDPTGDGFTIRTHGRGLLLMRTFMDQVTFNAIGNEVTMVKCRTSSAQSRSA